MRLVFSFALAICAFGADWGKLKPEGYVSDFARVIDAPSRESIDHYLAEVERASGAQVAIVTIDTLDGDFVEDVANKLYRQFGVGVKGKNEGALFLLVVKDRKTRLEVGYGLEPIVPDGVAGDILRSMRPALRAGDYGPALVEATRVLGTKIAAGKNITIAETLPARRAYETRSTREASPRVVQFLLVVGLVALFVMMSRRRGYGSGPWIFPGGGGYYGGGGGFGGGGGGGGASWGGFGGGDSGGGGASSDW